MILLSSAVSFLLSVLAGLGVGCGGLFVLWLVLILHWEQLPAQGANLLFFLASTIAAYPLHMKNRHIRFSRVLIIALVGCLFSFPGMWLAGRIGNSLLRKIFGALLLAGGIISFFPCKRQ